MVLVYKHTLSTLLDWRASEFVKYVASGDVRPDNYILCLRIKLFGRYIYVANNYFKVEKVA